MDPDTGSVLSMSTLFARYSILFSVSLEGVAAHAKFTRIAHVYKVPSGVALSPVASLASSMITAEKLFRAVAARMVCSAFGHVNGYCGETLAGPLRE